MDWDSIKRNLRFRSGRAKRAEKRYPSYPPTRAYESSGNPPSRTVAPSQPPAPRPVPHPSKPSPGPGVPNTKPNRPGSSAKDQNTVPSALPRSQTQAGAMDRPNGAVKQPKQTKGASRPQGKTTTADPAPKPQSTDDTDDFDLRPQPRKKKATSLDVLSESLFCGGHLDIILHDPELFSRFTVFLNRYRPQAAPVLIRYLETQKAIKAVEYANAVAQSVAPLPSDPSSVKDMAAAHLDTSFRDMRQNAFEQLLSEALPAYVTYGLIKVVTEIMVNEITGRSTPVMKGLVSGLSEVFCLTDPKQEDNPIIYASEEFYHMTGYSRDFVIGTNCRFLQGPKTKRQSVQRFRNAVDSGQELSEALLNYRRDGRPFMNVLMIAPLHDNKGNVKYHIGAQVDASGLIEGGKGLDGFEKYLASEQAKVNSRGWSSGKESLPSQDRLSSKEAKKKALEKLGELSEMFDREENAIVAQRSRSNSRDRRSDDEESTGSGRSRRVFAESSESASDEEGVGEKEKAAWSLSQTGSSGRLPGVYQSYFLMRPSPSLKIIFTSPALKKMGNLVQSTLLSHITAPPATLKGLQESFEAGNPVTAKVLFAAQASEYKTGRELDRGQSKKGIEEASSSKLGRTCWISATPLFGGDDEVGVWMVVLVDHRTLGSMSLQMHSNDRSQQTPPRKAGGNGPSDATPDLPTSNSTYTLTSRKPKPDHIAMPDSTESQHKMGTQQTGSVNWSSKDTGSPRPRKPSLKPQQIQSGHDIMARRDELLGSDQFSKSSPQNVHQSNKDSTEDADEFVRKYEPRDLSTTSNRVHIRPDTEDEDEEFQLATEGEVENGVDHVPTPEGHENVPVDNGSVPGDKGDTVSKKDSNIVACADPVTTSKDGAEDLPHSPAAQETAPESPQKNETVSEHGPESETVPESEKRPAPAPVPLSQQALQVHDAALAAKEDATESRQEPQVVPSQAKHTSPSNQIQQDPQPDPDPPILTGTEVEEGDFLPTSVKINPEREAANEGNGDGPDKGTYQHESVNDSHEREAQQVANVDDPNTSLDQHESFHETEEPSHTKSAAVGMNTAGGYMDYLRHPGSRPSSRGGRTITATNLASQGLTMAEIGNSKWDRHEDPDCVMRSPFSGVD